VIDESMIPPNDLHAERALLGGIVRDPFILAEVRESIAGESFYFDAHRQVWNAMIGLADSNSPIDLIAIHDRLAASKQLADVGGAAYLAELWEAVPTGASAIHHAGIIRGHWVRRWIIQAANELIRDAHARKMPANELIADFESKVFALSQSSSRKSEVHLIGDVIREVMQDIEDRISSGSTMSGIPTGYPDLDDMLGGLKPGELLVIGARPSVGKTAFALNVMSNIARTGVPVFLSSIEQRRKEIGSRLLAMGSGVPMHRIVRGSSLESDEVERLMLEASPQGVGGCGLYIDDSSSQSASHILTTVRRCIAKFGIQLVVIDYLQLMVPDNPTENRTQQVGTLTRRMKLLARECNVPVMLLAQLNRENEKEKRHPRLSDLRDSGEIEQHADNAIFLHRDADLPQSDPVWPIDVIVAKQRNGPIGSIQLGYRRAVMRFENMAKGFGN
jgi:replicative DNA helicase